MREKIDRNATAYLWLNTANRWLGLRLDYIGASIVFCAIMASLTAGVYGFLTLFNAKSGLVGLSIAYAFMVRILIINLPPFGRH